MSSLCYYTQFPRIFGHIIPLTSKRLFTLPRRATYPGHSCVFNLRMLVRAASEVYRAAACLKTQWSERRHPIILLSDHPL